MSSFWAVEPLSIRTDNFGSERNRLVSRLYGDGTRVSVQYDGNGDRFAKSITEPLGIPQFTYYQVDRNNLTGYAQVVEEIAQGGAVQVVYAYGLDLISQDRLIDDGQGGTTWEQSYYLYDGLGSVRGLADE